MRPGTEAYVCVSSCVRLCDPMACSPPGSSIHGILQARILEWVAMPSFMGSSQPRDQTQGSLMFPTLAGRFLPLVPSGKPQGNANQDHNKRWFCPNRMTLKKKKIQLLRRNWSSDTLLVNINIQIQINVFYTYILVYTHTHMQTNDSLIAFCVCIYK